MADSPDPTRLVECARVRSLALRAALLTSLVVFAALAALDAGLRSPHARFGMISFELAGAEAGSILDEWSEAQRRDALLLQGLDYLFIPAYATLLATAALTLATRRGVGAPGWVRFAPVAAWAAVVAGVADAIENIPLIGMLRDGAASQCGAAIAQISATVKFTLVALVMLYLTVARVAAFAGER